MYLFISIICFLIGFVFFTLHESNAFKGTFESFGKWFEFSNPVEMKKKLPLLPMAWNFYHFAGWFMLFSFFNSMFFAALPLLNKPWITSYTFFGAFLGFAAIILNLLLYGIYGKEKK